MEEFKAFNSSLKEPAEYNKFVSTLQNFNDVLFVFSSGRIVSKRIISCSIERVLTALLISHIGVCMLLIGN